MFTVAKQKLSPLLIWAQTFELYRYTWAKVWYWAFVMALIMGSNVFVMDENLSWPILAYNIIAAILIVFITSVVLCRIQNFAQNETKSLWDSTRFILRKYPTIFASMLVFYIFITLIPFLLIIFALGIGVTKFFVIALTCAAIIGIFIFSLLAFNLPFILFKNHGWFKSLKSSVLLVWHNWLRTVVVFIVPMLIFGVINGMLKRVVGVEHIWLSILITSAYIAIVSPFLSSLLLVQFNDLLLRTKREF